MQLSWLPDPSVGTLLICFLRCLSIVQKWLGPYIAKKRSPRIREQYRQIGGKSPIGDWTAIQGDGMIRTLARIAPGEGPFKRYIAFRYAPPLTEETLLQMKADGVKRAVLFSQFPHYSCTTTGSSLNHLWRELIRLNMEKDFTWSIVDRWPVHPTFVHAIARCVAVGLQRFPAEVRDQVIIVFSAHSVPMLVVNKGDQYVAEVAATVTSVMEVLQRGKATLPAAAPADGSASSSSQPDDGTLGTPVPPVKSPHILAWQSKVGFLPWMGPQTGEVIKGLGKQGHKYVLTVPIAFTSDHIETLFEIDIEYAEEAAKVGIVQFERAPSLNGEEAISTAQAQIIAEHLGLQKGSSGTGASAPSAVGDAGQAAAVRYPPVAVASPQYAINCPGCTNPACRTILNPAAPYTKLRDRYDPAVGCKAVAGSPWPTPAEVQRLKALSEPSP